MKPIRLLFVLIVALLAARLITHTGALGRAPIVTPGKQPDGKVLVTTNQIVSPIGIVRETTGGRPKEIALSPDGRTLAVLNNSTPHAVLLFNTQNGEPTGFLDFARHEPAAMGLAWSPDGNHIYAACTGSMVARFTRSGSDTSAWTAEPDIHVGAKERGDSNPLGLAVSKDGKRLYVAMSRRNAVAAVNLADGSTLRTIGVGVSPYAILLSHDGKKLYVANRGGKLVAATDSDGDGAFEPSAGTRVRVDPETDAAINGTISVVDVKPDFSPVPADATVELECGKHPSGLALNRGDKTLYVACADSDDIELFDTHTLNRISSISLTPDEDQGFGQIPDSIALSDDEKTLFVACGGENAVAVIRLGKSPSVVGRFSAGWYPQSVAQRHGRLYIGSAKGIGPRTLDPKTNSYYVHNSIGTVQFVAPGDWRDLPARSREVAVNNRWGVEPEARPGQQAVPVPERVGEASVFKHVVYIIKENQSYDSLLGDMREGNGDVKLNLYGENVCPNHHRIAREFVLLDNTYTSGTNSADGHQWCDEAVANNYTEQNYGANVRSYPYDGGDPLTYSPNGFLWTTALRKKLSVRVYGEFVNHATIQPTGVEKGIKTNWLNLYNDRTEKTGKFKISAATDCKALAPLLHPNAIGFPLVVSDQFRADQFLDDLASYEAKDGDDPAKDSFPSLNILTLICDHTSGTSPGMPTPASQVADNDLALGRVVDKISHSRYWKDTLILVIEDDSQAAVDHVDGHRTAAFCISPYTRRHVVVSENYNHPSLLRTMELVLGLPAMTRFDRSATPLYACFTGTPDFAPYLLEPNRIPLDQINRPRAQLRGEPLKLANLSAAQDYSAPDLADANIIARADWYSRKPNTPFPTALYEKSEKSERNEKSTKPDRDW